MKVYYVGDKIPPIDDQEMWLEDSIFLAGPTPRSDDVVSWRKEALQILEKNGFEGNVFVPETKDWNWLGNYEKQVRWEWDALGLATITLFWVPRDLETMPAYTTNVEFGFIAALRPERFVLGFPPDAPKTRYLATIAKEIERFHQAFSYDWDDYGKEPAPVATTLEDCLMLAVAKVNEFRD